MRAGFTVANTKAVIFDVNIRTLSAGCPQSRRSGRFSALLTPDFGIPLRDPSPPFWPPTRRCAKRWSKPMERPIEVRSEQPG